jgi:hypothetical protein
MIPKKLYRFFEKEDYAQQFINGKIRIGNIEYYKIIEDKNRKNARRDEEEGKLSYFIDKPAVFHLIDSQTLKTETRISLTEKKRRHSSVGNPLYLLCTHSIRANKKKMSEDFGKYMVEINNPSGLLELLRESWTKHPLNFKGVVKLEKVRYFKGNLVRKSNYGPPYKFHYIHKSENYRFQHEYRFVFLCDARFSINLEDLKNHECLVIPKDNNVIKNKIIFFE